MKITAVIGSPNTEKSNTVCLTKDFLENVQRIDTNIEYEIISLGSSNILPCNGCWACMKIGKCVLNDDIIDIQNKLLESDLIIFGSPVYVHQISGQMKTFIDRMFIWVHLMKLMGKPSLFVTTTAQTGLNPVNQYLKKVLRLMGTITVGNLHANAYRPGVFPKREYYKTKYNSLAKKVVRILNGKKKYYPSFKNHIYFHALQITYQTMPQHLPLEHNYWKDKKWNKTTLFNAIRMERRILNKKI